MFAEVKYEIALGYLHIDWECWLKAMFPVEFHAKETNIKVFGFGFIKNSQDGDGLKLHDRWRRKTLLNFIERRNLLGLMRLNQRLNHLVQIALHDVVDFVQREVDAVV